MKKVFALALATLVTLALTACGSTSSSAAPSASAAAPTSSQASKPASSAASASASQTSSGTFEKNGFQYITASQLKSDIDTGNELLLLDIQPEDKYNAAHLPGVIATYAFPVETEEEQAKVEAVLPQLTQSEAPVIIICPGGKTGAENTWAYLVSQDFDMSRVFILENGQTGWPYPEMLDGAASGASSSAASSSAAA